MKTTFAGRKFQFWQYSVSHGELLVRSPKDAAHPRNADIMFAGVEYVDLPRFLADLEVDEPSDEDLARAEERLGKPVGRQSVVVLKSQGRHYLVVAAAAKAVASDMDIFDSPFK
jgi:hypothetical protein